MHVVHRNGLFVFYGTNSTGYPVTILSSTTNNTTLPPIDLNIVTIHWVARLLHHSFDPSTASSSTSSMLLADILFAVPSASWPEPCRRLLVLCLLLLIIPG